MIEHSQEMWCIVAQQHIMEHIFPITFKKEGSI